MYLNLAPVVIFTYKRLDTLQVTIESLKVCNLSKESDIFIFSDAAKNEKDLFQVNSVRSYLNTLTGFKSITIYFAETNKGLANSIIQGVTNIICEYGKVIVLEDDLKISNNFLVYMNQALSFYELNLKVFSVAGYTMPIVSPENYQYDTYFTPRASSWGWATWRNRWGLVDWNMTGYSEFRKNKKEILRFNRGGSDMSGMLERQMKGEINSWAIRWCYHQFKTNTVSVYPVISKIQNIGFSNQATHSNVYNRYKSSFDISSKVNFVFPKEVIIDTYFLTQFQLFFSVKKRIFNKISTYLYKLGVLANDNV